MRRVGYASAILAATTGSPAAADDAKTYGEAFNVPVFESIDQNGVNLITGQLQVVSPTISGGSDEARITVGLRWTGRAWTEIDVPQIWRKGSVYTVVYGGVAEEFNGRTQNYSQKKPITGSKLSCSIYEPGNIASECQYISRNGDVIHFRGMYSNITPYPGNYGISNFDFGNIGISEARLYSVDRGFSYGLDKHVRQWGGASIGGLRNPIYNKRDYKFSLYGQTLLLTTPNHDGTDTEEHYLLPKNTTQTITDDLGATWAYTIDNDRRMTLIDPPGNAASISIAYNGDHKVTSVTNADGVWRYSYGSGTTTVTSPLGEVTYIKYNTDKNYVTEARDANLRTTYYQYDSGDRLSQVTFPEGNSLNYTYDARGNIIRETRTPKPGLGIPISRSADYPATCSNAVLCNLPAYTVDSAGNRTDFEYAPTGTINVATYPISQGTALATATVGTRKPTRILLPPDVNGVRPEIRNSYEDGMLIRSAECRTTANCVGTADEVVTEYDYGGTAASRRLPFGVTVTAGGISLRTCHSFDMRGQVVSQTPPNAQLASCSTTLTATLAANAVAPVAANAAAAPTYPDGATGGGDPPVPVDPCARPGMVSCQ